MNPLSADIDNLEERVSSLEWLVENLSVEKPLTGDINHLSRRELIGKCKELSNEVIRLRRERDKIKTELDVIGRLFEDEI